MDSGADSNRVSSAAGPETIFSRRFVSTWFPNENLDARRTSLELDAQSAKKELHVRQGGFYIVDHLDIEGDVERLMSGAGNVGQRFFHGGDEGGKCGQRLGSG